MKRTPLSRGTSQLKRSPLKKVNTERKAKRVTSKRKHYASPEYKAARKEQVKISGGRCEAIHVSNLIGSLCAILLPTDQKYQEGDSIHFYGSLSRRCTETEKLQFHETSYGSKTGLKRSIKGVMLCPCDHSWIELTRHPHRQRSR